MIEVDHLVKRFGAVTAVDGLSFTVRPGHVTGFLGPNGAGKTTTMRVILGLDAPTSGTARVNQKSYTGLIRPLHQVGALLDAQARPRIGNAVGLDTPASVIALLRAMADAGYDISGGGNEFPGVADGDGDALIHAIIAAGGRTRTG